MANWIKGAIRDTSHPVQRAAKAKGISTREEAERESHSPNRSIRSRGILAKRFQSGEFRYKGRRSSGR